MQRRKGTHRTQRLLRIKRSHRNTSRNRSTHRNRSRTHRNRSRTHRNRTHHSKRIICNRTKRNRTKGGNYDTDVTIQTRELVPIKSKGVVVAMPGYVFSAEEYVDHMEYMDRQGSP